MNKNILDELLKLYIIILLVIAGTLLSTIVTGCIAPEQIMVVKEPVVIVREPEYYIVYDYRIEYLTETGYSTTWGTTDEVVINHNGKTISVFVYGNWQTYYNVEEYRITPRRIYV